MKVLAEVSRQDIGEPPIFCNHIKKVCELRDLETVRNVEAAHLEPVERVSVPLAMNRDMLVEIACDIQSTFSWLKAMVKATKRRSKLILIKTNCTRLGTIV